MLGGGVDRGYVVMFEGGDFTTIIQVVYILYNTLHTHNIYTYTLYIHNHTLQHTQTHYIYTHTLYTQ